MQNQNEAKTLAVFGHSRGMATAKQMESEGYSLVVLPAPAILSSAAAASVAGVLGRVGTFDWVVFGDHLAVHYFYVALEHGGMGDLDLDDVRVCAVGEASAIGLRERFAHVDVVSRTSDPRTIVEDIENYAGGLEQQRILAVTRNRANVFPLSFGLSRGLHELAVYALRFDEDGRARALFMGGAIDAVLISSSDDVIFLEDWLCDIGAHDPASAMPLLSLDPTAHRTAIERRFNARPYRR
jgi:uroporphyrinogen-III synthase